MSPNTTQIRRCCSFVQTAAAHRPLPSLPQHGEARQPADHGFYVSKGAATVATLSLRFAAGELSDLKNREEIQW
ncbi:MULTISPECIES: hypothetical protein [Gordonia]|uniref:Uncharacterized protein n=1 Tax=Gordonia rubripertincta TaxID=36822 RepID=A0AAW6RA60_GORRU|nr:MULTISPECIES: hypothetical protein [Gordonia]MDG6783157.1 hypothetical protein [Gordonia rubripertincta]NKY65432.1 hypothetical protein [Gordonia rubripertincta]